MKSAVPALTGVRGLAALWVLLFHMQSVSGAFGCGWLAAVPWLGAGWHGVDLFFVLSGYVLMRAHGKDFARPSAAAITAFAKLRLSRIYPLHLVVLAAVVAPLALDAAFVASRQAHDPGAFSGAALLKAAALATRWGLPGTGEWNEPVWSLSAEMVGYTAFPALAWMLMRTRRTSVAVQAALVTTALLAVIQMRTQPDGYNRIDTFGALTRMAFAFFAGAAFARARTLAPAALDIRFRRAGEVAALGLLALCAVERFAWAVLPAFVLIVASLESREGVLARLMSSPVAVWLGRVSFPLYLIHVMPLLWLAFHARTGAAGAAWGPWVFAAYLPAMLGLAFVLHRAVEMPAQRWGRRWAASAARPSDVQAAGGARLRTG